MTDKVNILVVDDIPAQHLAIEAALTGLGENLVTASSGREALKFLLDHDVAVILLDVKMPEMDGFETAALIRRRPRSANTPIIFMTADNDELKAMRGYALGAVDYIIRPFMPDVLRTKVQVFVTLSRAQDRLRREAEQRVILSREQARRALAEEHGRRARFLAEASGILTRSLERPAFVDDLLSLFLPGNADVVGIVLKDSDGPRWRRADPLTGSGQPLDRPPADLAARLDQALVRGLGGVVPNPDGMGQRGIVVPLEAYGQTLGALAVAMEHSRRTYAEADLDLIRDVASRTAIAIDNLRLYRALSERDRRKDEFLAMLSHELRNPLGAITTAAYVLGQTHTGDARVNHARSVIERQAAHLGRIVDDLLEVSRVTAGRITLSREPVQLRSIVDGVLEALRLAGRLDERRVQVHGNGVTVDADAARTEQVVTNLVVNAVKYTTSGGAITIRIETSGGHGLLTVADDGVGMAPDLLVRVFDLFVQGARTLDRSQGGLGIGLTLVRKLVELQGGSVLAHSDGAGRGSRFEVRLPLALALPDAEKAEEVAAGATAPLRILVVDDNNDFREMLRALLEWKGHLVDEAASGPEALVVAEQTRPDLALVDLGLPGFDGVETARQIRAIDGLGELFLVAVTGYGQPDDQRRTAASGFDGHLVKPVSQDRLDRTLALAAARRSDAGATPDLPGILARSRGEAVVSAAAPGENAETAAPPRNP